MTFPASPFNGASAEVNGIAYIYDSAKNAWLRSTTRTYASSTTPPVNPTPGTLWYKTDTDVLYEYLSDGTSFYWFDMNTQSLAANAGGITTYLGESFSGNLTVTGNITGSLGYMLERTNLVADSAPAVTNVDILTCPILYYTANATTNIIANLRGNSTTSLNSIVGNGQSVTFSLFVPQQTAYYITEVRVDNVSQPIAWQGYVPVTEGNEDSIDLYTFTAVKGADFNWRIFGSQTSYTHTGEWLDYSYVNDPLEYLVIGGGGSGGTSYGGGGGAGGVRYGIVGRTIGTYTVTVGSGGAARTTNSVSGASGTASSISGPNIIGGTVTAAGGGAGGAQGNSGVSGASGGGGGSNNSSPGGAGNTPATAPAQGYSGGSGVGGNGNRGAGGGGGAGGAGANGTDPAGGAGGAGTNTYSQWATATSTGVGGYYAGGGGGGAISGTNVGGAGGSGGGGAGASGTDNSATAGTANTGGGGGGMGDISGSASSGAGGSGIVIVRTYASSDVASGTTGSPTILTNLGYRYYVFTGSGTITW